MPEWIYWEKKFIALKSPFLIYFYSTVAIRGPRRVVDQEKEKEKENEGKEDGVTGKANDDDEEGRKEREKGEPQRGKGELQREKGEPQREKGKLRRKERELQREEDEWFKLEVKNTIQINFMGAVEVVRQYISLVRTAIYLCL